MKRFVFIVIIALQWTSVTGQPRHITVAADGSGEFTSVHEAVNSVRAYMSDTTYMFIKDGVYREKVIIPSWVTNLFMKGESAEKTIITWNDHANIRNMGTFRTYTIWILGSGFTAENITFENNAEQLGPGCRRACRCRQGGSSAGAGYWATRILFLQPTRRAGSITRSVILKAPRILSSGLRFQLSPHGG